MDLRNQCGIARGSVTFLTGASFVIAINNCETKSCCLLLWKLQRIRGGSRFGAGRPTHCVNLPTATIRGPAAQTMSELWKFYAASLASGKAAVVSGCLAFLSMLSFLFSCQVMSESL